MPQEEAVTQLVPSFLHLYLENGAFDNADSKEIKMIFFEFWSCIDLLEVEQKNLRTFTYELFTQKHVLLLNPIFNKMQPWSF